MHAGLSLMLCNVAAPEWWRGLYLAAYLAVLVFPGHHSRKLLLVASSRPISFKHAVPAACSVPEATRVRLS